MIVDWLGRALDLYRQTTWSRTAIALIVANAIPLVGALFFDWSLITILVIYWIENAIVGFWNVPKIVLAQGSMIPAGTELPPASRVQNLIGTTMPSAGRAVMAAFFVIHYGGFWLGHGVFVLAGLPAFVNARNIAADVCGDPFPTLGPCEAGPLGAIVWSSVAIAAIALFLSHGASFFINYLGRREYLRTSPTRQMGSPYGRVVVLHLTILIGAFVVAFIGSPIGALLVLVVLKTAFDLRLHLREHTGALLTAA